MKRIAIDLHYLPCLEFFAAILDAEELLLFPKDLYQRQSYLNRTRIRLANKVETLSIPIQGRRPRVAMGEVQIDYSQKWQSIHLRGIQSAYGKAPFFEYFYPYLEEIFESKEESLWEFNLSLMTICLRLLRLPVRLVSVGGTEFSSEYLDVRGQITPGRPFFERNYYQPVKYSQLFGLDFEPNLSVLDLLFCTGPDALNILRQSIKKQ